MALTASQQQRFHKEAMRWLDDQLAAGNDKALYQLWKSTVAQVKNAIAPYLATDRSAFTTQQSTLPATRTAQDTGISAGIAEIDAITADANP